MINLRYIKLEQGTTPVIELNVIAFGFSEDFSAVGSYSEMVDRITMAMQAAFRPGPTPTIESIYSEIHGRKITL